MGLFQKPRGRSAVFKRVYQAAGSYLREIKREGYTDKDIPARETLATGRGRVYDYTVIE